MDYTRTNLSFKVRKAARYVRLYGFRRTFLKIKGQYHVKSTDQFQGPRWLNSACRTPGAIARNVAIIGCGNYAFSTIAYYLSRFNSHFLRVTFDTDKSKARSLCKAYRGAYAVADWKEILSDPQVKIVFIASNHASHAEYAVACVEAGKHVHIEKPHVVSEEQLKSLITTMRQSPCAKVFLGFNRPRSPLFRRLLDSVARESGPLMINWFIAGHEIPENHWYFDEKEGGRILGNLCHWTDLTLHLITLQKAFPCTIVPATPRGAKSDFIVSAIFADQSCATITFSAKGHAFEGVREVLNLHKGNLIANLTDFQTLTMDVVEKKETVRLRHRDHGHGISILNSLAGVTNDDVPGESISYVAASAKLFLAIRQAVDTGAAITLSSADILRAAA